MNAAVAETVPDGVLRILLVDDEPIARLILSRPLLEMGHRITTAVSGNDAIQILEKQSFDLILLDVDMSGMNGMEVCVALRGRLGALLPIMMVTGLDDVASIEQAYRSGASGFIIKPVNWALLPHRVNFQLRAARTLADLAEARPRSERLRADLAGPLEAIPDLLFDIDRKGRYLSVHAQHSELLWEPAEIVIGQHLSDVLPADAAGVCMAALAEARVTGLSRGRQFALNLGRGTHWFELSVARKLGADTEHSDYIMLARDITQVKQQQKQLEHFTHFDPLTCLPNRALLSDRLQQAMLLARRRKLALAVVVLDVDDFTQVNDRYGSEAGDRLLVALAERLQAALRDGDTLARIGGDEFVVVLTDLAEEHEAFMLVERLLAAATAPVLIGEHTLQVSFSAGMTRYPQDAVQAEALIRHADQAMYLAKQAGKHRVLPFDVDHDVVVKSLNEGVERLRGALAGGEFVLFYQPKVDLEERRVIGVEALIRWQHPERGLLLPTAFLGLLEQRPLSLEVGQWVIETALAQLQRWRSQGLELTVSVNIGGAQIQQDDFVAWLGCALSRQEGLPAGCLQLELLETAALQDLARVSQTMQACHGIGVGFALDDFGTGYSSLSYLKHLPVDTLKIDQNFVRDILTVPNDLAIVKGVIGLAQAFGREVIAEGVETRAHGELLRSIGCTRLQGYGIAQPMAADALPAWITTWNGGRIWQD